MRPDDIRQLHAVAAIVGLADGRVVAEVRRPDPERDRITSTLRLIDSVAGTARALTRGPADSAPVLSPDGRRLAFLRRDGRGMAQPHVIAIDGGEAVGLAVLPLGAMSLSWAPSGERLAVVARRPESGRYGTDPAVAPDAEPPRRITTANWRLEGTGYVLDRPASLALIEVPADDALLEEGDAPQDWHWVDAPAAEWSEVRWRSSGAALLAIGNAHPTRDADLRRDLYEIALDGAVRNLTAVHGSFEVLSSVEFDDGRIALALRDMGADGRDYAGAGAGIALLAGDEWRVLTDLAADDIGATAPIVRAGASSVDATARRRGDTHLVRLDVATGELTTLVDGCTTVTAHAVSGGTAVWGAATTDAPAAVGRAIGDTAALWPLPFALRVHASVETTVVAPDGYPVHGWIAVPDGAGPHPVVLCVHGGPYAQYGGSLADELQVLVSAGYAVVQCNPRGSAGYGRAHARAIRGRVGTDDMTDVLAFLDAAMDADTRLDPRRVGIMGGSYGGFLTAWILGHTDRFRGAIVERGWFDPAVFTGTSDIGSFYADEYIGTAPEAIARQSPQAVAERVVTPTLVLHSEGDLRCPIGQSERYYTTLRRAGVETEFVVFPGEGHELTRSGRPRHRVERFAIVLEWWARQLSPPSPSGHPISARSGDRVAGESIR